MFALLLMTQSVLTKQDRGAISVLLNHLRTSVQDLINIALRFTSATVRLLQAVPA